MPCVAKKSTAELQEADGGVSLLIGQHLGKGHARVVIDGHVQGQEAGVTALASQAAIAAQRDLAEARHALDIQVQQVARPWMLIALYRRWRIQVAPSAQPCPAQDSADRSRTQPRAPRDLVAGHVPATKCKYLFH